MLYVTHEEFFHGICEISGLVITKTIVSLIIQFEIFGYLLSMTMVISYQSYLHYNHTINHLMVYIHVK